MKNNKFDIVEKNNLFIFSNNEYEVYYKSANLSLGYKKFKNLLDKKEKFLKKNNIDINDKKKINLDNAHKHTIKSENEIIKFSEKEIDLETQNKIIISLKKIKKKYKPFLKEINLILD